MKPVPPDLPEAGPTRVLLGLLLSLLLGGVAFVLLWAGLNFAFGSALDGPIGGFVMETPCQRLAGTSEALDSYSLASKGRFASSVCHFASGRVTVAGATDGYGFTWREFVYLMIGFVGYAACFAGALLGAILLVRAGRKLVNRR